VSDLPTRIHIQEEGPREGFQIEQAAIPTEDKVRLIEALAETGLATVQCVSFVDPKRVPGMADADIVARTIRRRPGVQYTCIWLNLRGLERAAASGLDMKAKLGISASESFSRHNTNRGHEDTLHEQRRVTAFCRERGIALDSAIVMTAFGCNYEGEVAPARVVACASMLIELAAAEGVTINRLTLADTVGWANPASVQRVVGSVRERWPDLALTLHLHDTRGTAMANALAGLQLGIASFDSSCAGLGGCPFAGHKSAAGNICTEDLVFLCEEMGIATGIDLDALIECARMAEAIVGHPLPGKVMHGGSLTRYRSTISQRAMR
jgi:hydroxymethylglutaryl-CoA lyase